MAMEGVKQPGDNTLCPCPCPCPSPAYWKSLDPTMSQETRVGLPKIVCNLTQKVNTHDIHQSMFVCQLPNGTWYHERTQPTCTLHDVIFTTRVLNPQENHMVYLIAGSCQT